MNNPSPSLFETSAPETRRAAPLDAAVLSSIRNLNPSGYPALLERLVKAYLSYSTDAIGALQAALAASDQETLGKAAHSLKSSSGNLGATQLAALCKELEMIGRGQSDADPAPLLDATTREHRAVCEALQIELAKVSGVVS